MTTSVSLRPMTAEMYHAYYKEYQNDPDLYLDKGNCTPFVYSPEWVEQYVRRQSEKNRKCFAILVGEELAGEVILKDIVPGRRATLGICMKNDQYKNRGFGTRAEQLAVDYVFRELDIRVLYADSILTNTRSQHVLEKVGFRCLRTDGEFKYYRIKRDEEPRISKNAGTKECYEVRLLPVDEDNRKELELLRVHPSQEPFIASNSASLRTGEENPLVARSYGIYAGRKPVGFVMLAIDEQNEDPDDRYWIWRFMIDKREQGKGLGSAALKEILTLFRRMEADPVTLSTKPENTVALGLYHRFGFLENGQRNGDEIVLKLRFSQRQAP